MSIVTKTGDDGTTALMYNRRVPKTHPRVEACGAVDELNAALGMARAAVQHQSLREKIYEIQQELVALMGELATLPEDLERYHRAPFPKFEPSMIGRLEAWVKEMEAQQIQFKGWVMPGETPASAALDWARAVCRRTERHLCHLEQEGPAARHEFLVYFNRLSDLLWLMGRWIEYKSAPPSTGNLV